MKVTPLLLLALLFIVISLHASTRHVPADYPTIQAAINASSGGDTIIVSPGIYYENINFRGRNVFVTSLYYLNSDTSYITSTVINGSSPIHPDSASCVIFNSGEDTTAVLQGFTITGGSGTKWTDIHGAGIYREGGGILMDLSSPAVRHNLIISNSATNTTGVVSAGGGGIRIGDGNPIIQNNVISLNQGRYGAGIVLNYTGCRIRNNVISANTGGQDYNGGSGIWILNNHLSLPKIIENNTIINNYSSLPNGTGGILNWSASNVYLTNNIIWGNVPATQIRDLSGGLFQVTYNDVMGGFSGSGNINQDPMISSLDYFLSNGSPCIDKGDSSIIYNDISDPGNPGNAFFPSKGLLRNDMGAYGGPYASLLASSGTLTAITENVYDPGISFNPNPFSTEVTVKIDRTLTNATLIMYNESGVAVRKAGNLSGHEFRMKREDLPAGVYFIRLVQDRDTIATGKLMIID